MSHQPADLEEVLKGLPHAEPFRFLDRVVKLEEDLAEGVWSVRGDTPTHNLSSHSKEIYTIKVCYCGSS